MRLFVSIIFSFLSITSFSQKTSLELQLFELPDVIFKPIEGFNGFTETFELRVKQPIDHSNPEAGHFYQRAFLSHKSLTSPMVIVTEGYERSYNRISELSELLNANQLVVEHRYFGQSIPEEKDYTYLTLEQATADLHKINELFKQVYKEKWISTGISKGGQTTIYYRYFYPNDVAVSVPYVAPFNLEFEEERIYHFLDTIGTDECRKNIRDLQYNLFKNRNEILDNLRWYAYGAGLDFGYLGLEAAFEYAVLEYPFMFWQWGTDCSALPTKNATVDELLIHLINVSNIDFYSDESMEKYGSHYYQAATEMGYYGYQTEPFKDYLKALPLKPNPHAAFVPNHMEFSYDNSLAKKAYKWIQESGDRFIYIYGGNDTWTATAIPVNKERDAAWITMPGKDHGAARIKNMTKEEQEILISNLERWLEVSITKVDWLK